MRRIAILIGLWSVAGYLATALVIRIFELPFATFQGAILGLLIGLIWLASATSTEQGRHLFYEGPDEDEDGDPVIGCLWVTPLIIMLLAAIGWVYWFLFVWYLL